MMKKLSLLILSLLMLGAGEATERPSLFLDEDPARSGCGGVGGRYIALLFPGEGLSVLSRREFPEARVVGAVEEGRLEVSLPGVGSWDHAARGGEGSIWGLFHRTELRGSTPGCIAFDKDRFTWSSDLLTYVRWIVEEAYLSLPVPRRQEALPLLVSDRRVVLRARFEGHEPVELEGKEASTLAFRLPDGERTYLLRPFVVDREIPILLVHTEVTRGKILSPSEKRGLGSVVVGPEAVAVPTETAKLQLQAVAVRNAPD